MKFPVWLGLVVSIGCADDPQQTNNIYFQPNNSLPNCDMAGDFDMSEMSDDMRDADVGTNPCVEIDWGTDAGTQTDTGTDTGTQTDTGTDTGMDMEPDVSNPVDMPPDMVPEIIVDVCDFPNGGTYTGNCDVVRGTGCSGAQECLISQQVVGETVIQIGVCRVPEQSHTLGEFANCNGTVERCALGLACFFGTCRKLCYPADGTGCLDEDQFCRQPSTTWPGLGYCASQCVGPG